MGMLQVPGQPPSGIAGRASDRDRGGVVCVRGPLGILLLFTFAALLPLASASPVDPTWLAGLYDEGDADGVIWLVERMEAMTPVAPYLKDT